MNAIFDSKQGRVLGLLLLLMVVVALGSYAMLNLEKLQYVNPTIATISVAGEGEVLAVPDIGQFSFAVTAEGAEAAVAQEASGTKINAVLAYLKEQGVEDKDIKVEYYNLNPRYRYEERVCMMNSYCPPGEQIADGFEVTQSVSVKVRDTKKAPTLITGVGEKGATNISSLEFTVDDIEALRDEARAKAITDAQEKAGVLADQLGVRLVKFVSYYEDGGYTEPFYRAKTLSMDAAMAESAFGGAELPVGEESTKVQVTVTYEVK
jgi:uncharacterized protein YggE